ncbi:MAG: hypothetical protein LQ351_001367 [Letrouitia transgressa]|nr:MAG: hypothetical protein LQ351_001367 [Letrouitia transgressa]
MSTVVVHIIDSTSRLQGIPTAIFMEPSIKGFEELRCPAYSFLIEHPDDGRKLLFDLGVRKDWENLAPTIQKNISHWNAKVIVEKGVAEILEEGGVGPQEVEAIIWSHYHWDHTGDPSTFPPSTDLIVGPGFKKAMLPGWPANPDSPIRESDYEGRNLREIPFATDLQMGGCRAFDFFGDGSFYLLDTPGVSSLLKFLSLELAPSRHA